jgi:hypothetical protein
VQADLTAQWVLDSYGHPLKHGVLSGFGSANCLSHCCLGYPDLFEIRLPVQHGWRNRENDAPFGVCPGVGNGHENYHVLGLHQKSLQPIIPGGANLDVQQYFPWALRIRLPFAAPWNRSRCRSMRFRNLTSQYC